MLVGCAQQADTARRGCKIFGCMQKGGCMIPLLSRGAAGGTVLGWCSRGQLCSDDPLFLGYFGGCCGREADLRLSSRSSAFRRGCGLWLLAAGDEVAACGWFVGAACYDGQS